MKWINLISFLAMILVNVCANVLKLGGVTTGEVSAIFPTLVTPAPYTFLIWGVIYLLLLVFVFYQMSFPTGESVWGNPGSSPWFMISCLLNIGWILSWHFMRIGLSLIMIAALFLSLILMNITYSDLLNTGIIARLSKAGLQLYLGWISVASLANAAIYLKKIGWNGLGLSDDSRALIMLFIGMIIGIVFLVVFNNPVSLFALIWAYVGIFINLISPSGYDLSHPTISIATVLIIAIMVVFLLNQLTYMGDEPLELSPDKHNR